MACEYLDNEKVLNGVKCKECCKDKLYSKEYKERLRDKENVFTCISCNANLSLNKEEINEGIWSC